ncbi:Lecithin:cholesterol acyltransferase-domain-containing protein [Pavlovales sp. CCMP2436]|nr:Lecithin:cholesterol acyltransferase-domain-containing protein [Pavlovales sp. CCMP2436]
MVSRAKAEAGAEPPEPTRRSSGSITSWTERWIGKKRWAFIIGIVVGSAGAAVLYSTRTHVIFIAQPLVDVVLDEIRVRAPAIFEQLQQLPDLRVPTFLDVSRKRDAFESECVLPALNQAHVRPKLLPVINGFNDLGLEMWAGHDCARSYFRQRLVWAVLIENLADLGYSPSNMWVGAYDWRLPYAQLEKRDAYFSRLRSHIELFRLTHDQKVVVLTHSMGSTVWSYFQQWVTSVEGGKSSAAWIHEYVQAVVLIGPSALGTPKAVTGLLMGESRDFTYLTGTLGSLVDSVLSAPTRRRMMRSFPSTQSLLPMGGEAVWGDAGGAPDDPPMEEGSEGGTVHGVLLQKQMPGGKIEPLLTSRQAMKLIAADAARSELSENGWSSSSEAEAEAGSPPFRYHYRHELGEPAELQHPSEATWINPLATALPYAPQLSMYCLYGVGVPTERSYVVTSAQTEEAGSHAVGAIAKPGVADASTGDADASTAGDSSGNADASTGDADASTVGDSSGDADVSTGDADTSTGDTDASTGDSPGDVIRTIVKKAQTGEDEDDWLAEVQQAVLPGAANAKRAGGRAPLLVDQRKDSSRAASRVPYLIDRSVNKGASIVNGCRLTDGDGTIPLVSLGYMCARGWRNRLYNPSGSRIVSREYPHEAPTGPVPGQRGDRSADHVDILGNLNVIRDVLYVAAGRGADLEDVFESDILRISEAVEKRIAQAHTRAAKRSAGSIPRDAATAVGADAVPAAESAGRREPPAPQAQGGRLERHEVGASGVIT